jgi:hypothetical protein
MAKIQILLILRLDRWYICVNTHRIVHFKQVEVIPRKYSSVKLEEMSKNSYFNKSTV